MASFLRAGAGGAMAVGILLLVHATHTPSMLLEATKGKGGNTVSEMRNQIRSLSSELSPMLGKLSDMRQEEESLKDRASALETKENAMRSIVHKVTSASCPGR